MLAAVAILKEAKHPVLDRELMTSRSGRPSLGVNVVVEVREDAEAEKDLCESQMTLTISGTCVVA